VSVMIRSERLDLLPFTPELLKAMMVSNAAALHRIVGARFTGGIVPPAMEDAVPMILEAMIENPSPWWGWLLVDRQLREAVGAVGFAGPPGGDGKLQMGYSIFPRFEGKGYASEGATAAVRWAFTQPDVTAVRATIPPWNGGSIRVAEKIGMKMSGESQDDEVGTLLVYEIADTISDTDPLHVH
jgi:RimJ/RimL family protein N-acetyltransferase